MEYLQHHMGNDRLQLAKWEAEWAASRLNPSLTLD